MGSHFRRRLAGVGSSKYITIIWRQGIELTYCVNISSSSVEDGRGTMILAWQFWEDGV